MFAVAPTTAAGMPNVLWIVLDAAGFAVYLRVVTGALGRRYWPRGCMAVAESWLKTVAGTWRRRYEGSAAQEFARHLGALDFGNQIILFGASLLLSVLPVIVLLSAFATARIDDDIARHMSLNAKASQDISKLFATPHVSFNISVLLALILSFAGTVGVALSIQQVYEKVFGHDHARGAGGILRCFAWVVCVGGLLIAEAVISKPIEHAPGGSVVILVVNFALLILFFWWTMHFLLAGRESWRRLRPAAVATALFWVGFGVFSSFYFSGSIVYDDRLYGPIGIVFDVVIWFIAVGAVITLGAVAGVVWEARRRRPPASSHVETHDSPDVPASTGLEDSNA